MTRIAIISNSDNSGGANRAAYRLHRNLLASDIDTKVLVRRKITDDWMVRGPITPLEKTQNFIRPKLGGLLLSLLHSTTNVNPHSGNILPSNWAATINNSDIDVVNLHWIGGETMSIEDIGRIRKPIVWTLHDMWAFCGAEHITDDGPTARWRNGYSASNRTIKSSGLDIDRYIWNRKCRAWKNYIQIITPSRWLANCVQQSALMREWPVSVIPNVLDTKIYKPLDRMYSRYILNLPSDKKIILFGALGGGRDYNKGYDLLLEALNYLSANNKKHNIMCVIFGQSKPEKFSEPPFPTQWMGHVHDEPTLALLYSAADVMVIPSRQENLPQSGTEAHACGCPVVAFNCTGLPEVVEHQITGYLAEPYKSSDMAHGISWILDDKERHTNLGLAARKKAEDLWAVKTIIPQYINAYELAKSCSNTVSFSHV